MSSVNQTEALNTIILSLEEKRMNEFRLLKEQLRLTGESLKPVNLIKSAANELTGNSNLRTYLIQAGIGLAVGLLTKKLMATTKTYKSINLVRNIAELGLNKLPANQAALIKMAAPIVLGLIINAIKNRRMKRHHSTGVEYSTS